MANIRGQLQWPAALVAITLVAGAGFLLDSRGEPVADAAEAEAVHSHHAAPGHDMDPEAMRQEILAFYALHPAHGGSLLGSGADTFRVVSFRFDTDGNAATQIDTAKIQVGESVLFKWVDGFHTTTSGNPGDPVPGTLWDHAIDSFAPQNLEFSVAFDAPGTYPFFCRPHGQFFSMKGVIVVQAAQVGVPALGESERIGFTRSPAPNPTHGGATFRFAMPAAGRARLEVFDAVGRRIAVVMDLALGAGVHEGAWNGRNAHGGRVAAGVYYLRLAIPQAEQTRRIVVER